MILIKNWKEFTQDISSYIQQNEQIEQEHKHIRTEEELHNLSSELKKWKQDVVTYLNSVFDTTPNSYANSIQYYTSNRYSFGNQKSIDKLIKEELENIVELRKQLAYTIKILNVSDAVVRPQEVNLEERRLFTTDEKLDLILEKLNMLYDDSYHSISSILEGNGVMIGRRSEVFELMKILEDYGLVNILPGTGDVSGQISLEGRRYIENRKLLTSTDYSKFIQSNEEVLKKLEQITSLLVKQGVGQEVLFNELDELKEYLPLMNKKSWAQLLKAKLIDLSISNAISKIEVGEILKQFVDL